MSKRLRCKLGIHDWEVLEIRNDNALIHNTVIGLGGKFGDVLPESPYCKSIRKVCVSCGKIHDTITPFIKEVERKYWLKKKRQAIAESYIVSIEKPQKCEHTYEKILGHLEGGCPFTVLKCTKCAKIVENYLS